MSITTLNTGLTLQPIMSPRNEDDFIASLASQYDTLNDTYTITGSVPSRKFNSYIYSRKLLMRKTIDNDEDHHMIFCTHCTKSV